MIKSLTSLRFFFALFVFLSHTGNYIKYLSNGTEFYQKYFEEGYLGVSFFFILSGFVLSYSYKEKVISKSISYKDFMVARFARVYPLHLLTLLLSLPVAMHFLMKAKLLTKLAVFFSHLFLLQSYIPQETFYFNFNGPSWSISDEMFFYFLFPMIFTMFKGKKKYILFIILMLVGIIIFSIINTNKNLVHSIFYINPIIRFLDFLLGIFLFELYNSVKGKQNLVNYIGNSWSEIFVVTLFILFYSIHQCIPQILRYSGYYWFPMLLIIFVFSFQGGFISKYLSNKIFVYLGEISFAFYLFHQLVFSYMKTYIINEDWLKTFPIVFIVICFIVTLFISALSFKYFETPINRFIKRKLIHEK